MAARRPNPALWVYYQYEGKLPERYRDWVLHDATCRTWLLRVLVRGLFKIVPVTGLLFAALVLFGGVWQIALAAVVLGLLVGIRYALLAPTESVDARLARHGFPARYGSEVRRRARDAEHTAAAERYRARWRSPES